MMTRFFSIAVLIAALGVGGAPAFAGNVTVNDGRGNWQSTKCTPPRTPAERAHDPEIAANDLNEQITLHNQFVAEAQGYMNCISQEAQIDAAAAGQVVTRVAESIIQQTQAQVAESNARLRNK